MPWARGTASPTPTRWTSGWPRPPKDDVLTLVYTSGTTGPPKGAMLTVSNVEYCIKVLVEGGGFAVAATIPIRRHAVLPAAVPRRGAGFHHLVLRRRRRPGEFRRVDRDRASQPSRAGEAVAAGTFLARVIMLPGSEPWFGFGQAEAADPFAGGELGQVLLLLRLVAEFVDRHHHQRALHAHHRAVARVDALDFARDQAVADVVQAGAAVLLGDRRPEQTERAHLAEDRGSVFSWRNASSTRGSSRSWRRRGRRRAPCVRRSVSCCVEQQRVVPVRSWRARQWSWWLSWSREAMSRLCVVNRGPISSRAMISCWIWLVPS